MKQCINCDKTDAQVSLLQMIYRGEEVHICPQCLPVLIHKPEKLADKLLGMQPGKSAEHTQ